jgi:hypothetical protein
MENDWTIEPRSGRDVIYVQPRQSFGTPHPGLHTNLMVMLALLRIAKELWGWLVRSFLMGFGACLLMVAVFRLMTHR